jgi:hypothetical protein
LAEYRETLRATRFDEVYFGGGSPTILAPSQIELLCSHIPRFSEIPLKCFEASPKTVRKEHVDVLATLGFKYVSLGVQTRDVETLRAQNREIVSERRLAEIVDWIEGAGMIANLDLIFFLKTGALEDIRQAETDLAWVMGDLLPTSITVHSEYRAAKSAAKQKAMMRSIRKACASPSPYSCTNSLLDEEADLERDMRKGAEYRLMRREKDFSFYLIGKLPSALRFGHNVLAIGEYDRFPLRTNYLHISDIEAPTEAAEALLEAIANEVELSEVRRRLGLSSSVSGLGESFFELREDERRFLSILQDENLQDLALMRAPLDRPTEGATS